MLRSSSATPIANGLWPNEWGPNHRHVATRTGDRVRVKLSTGWRITHTDGERTADASAPGYRQATGAIRASPAPALTNEVISDGVLWDASISRWMRGSQTR